MNDHAHPVFTDILAAFTGLPASISAHTVAAAADAAPDHGSPDRNMVASENLSAAGVTPDEMADVHARHREVVAEARRRVADKVAEIDKDNKGTPKTRLPWENR